ncbi:MAG TPA: 3-deoxy-7-phosphoheptulonate synthase [Planctomycetota bacterium]
MKTILACCFESDAPPAAVRECLELLGFPGPDPRWRWHAPGLLCVTLDAAPPPAVRERLQRLPGMQRVLDRSLASRPAGARSAVPLGKTSIGGGQLAVIAGPCSVESREQVVEIAAIVAAAGAEALRGGAYKPRTSPYAFGGLGEAGLEHLAAARERTGLPVVTEVLDTDDLPVVAQYADVLQIGSRNMQNFPLLFRTGAHPRGRPVLLKRGMAATLEEFRMAAEYVRLGQLWAGFDGRLILCERGIRTFEPSVRNVLDVAAIPLLQKTTDLPVIADPSHAAGVRELVRPLARAAVAAGADGLLVEVHTDPGRAWCDGEQTLDPAQFELMVREVRALAALRPAPPAGPRQAPSLTAARSS